MNTAARQRALRLAILTELRNSLGAGAVPESVVVSACYFAVSPVPTSNEVSEQLEWLLEEKYIAGLPAALGGLKYSITDAGRLALQA